MGSISSAALIYLFSADAGAAGAPKDLTLWGVLTAIIFSEHIYFATRLAVSTAMSKLDSPGLLKERRERFMVRRRFLQESLGVDEETESGQLGNVDLGKSVTAGDGQGLWGKQRDPKEAIEAGKQIIKGSLGKKQQ